MASTPAGAVASSDLVLFAYDGSELAASAIEQSARQLIAGREALVLCVWQPADVGFSPVGEHHFDADEAVEVERAAEAAAAHGAALAAKAGFQPRSMAVKAAPTWKGIVETAEQCQASLIVLGSHRRSGLAGRLLGSVAAAVVAHATSAVLVVHQESPG
jgi:nucleotide-binding universal stress UspA family protein